MKSLLTRSHTNSLLPHPFHPFPSYHSVSQTARPCGLAVRWAELILCEFFAQGDVEKEQVFLRVYTAHTLYSFTIPHFGAPSPLTHSPRIESIAEASERLGVRIERGRGKKVEGKEEGKEEGCRQAG